MSKDEPATASPFERFEELARRLFAVPKSDIEELRGTSSPRRKVPKKPQPQPRNRRT